MNKCHDGNLMLHFRLCTKKNTRIQLDASNQPRNFIRLFGIQTRPLLTTRVCQFSQILMHFLKQMRFFIRIPKRYQPKIEGKSYFWVVFQRIRNFSEICKNWCTLVDYFKFVAKKYRNAFRVMWDGHGNDQTLSTLPKKWRYVSLFARPSNT